LKGVVLILGPERFLAREALARALEGAADVARYDGKEARPGEVLDDARTPSLLGQSRAVVVEDAGDMLRESAEAFAAYARRPVPGVRLVLLATGLDRRLRGAKELEAAAEVVPCQPLKDREVTGWIGRRAREAHGLQVGLPAAEALRRRVGEDLGLLDAALSRLKEQIAPHTLLRPEDVEGSTDERRSPALFEPANALEAGDLPAALRAVEAAFDEGIRIHQDVVHEEKAVGPILLDNLHRAYVKLLRFHLHRRAGLGEEEAARRAGCSPQQAPFFARRARGHRLEALLARHRRFVEADLRLKDDGPDDAKRALEGLLVDLLAPFA
jgi:DNA polymerase III delta subunit